MQGESSRYAGKGFIRGCCRGSSQVFKKKKPSPIDRREEREPKGEAS